MPQIIDLNTSAPGAPISPLLFGHNIEHTRRAMWQGLSAQLVANRKFAGEAAVRGPDGTPAQPRGRVSPEGIVANWFPIGDAMYVQGQTTYAHETRLGYAGKESQKIALASGRGGIGQSQIPLQRGRSYDFRLWVSSDRPTTAIMRFLSSLDGAVYADRTLPVAVGDWRELHFQFTAPRTDEHVRLEMLFEGPATVWLGAASLLPADHFLGLRRDVVELLKEMSAPILRWPGGNFTLDYRWQDGLLPVDQRPVIKLSMSEVLPFTNSCDCHELGIDDFITLCRYVNAEPFLTINLRPSSIGTVADAVAWVEYCNGAPETKWGGVRASRGQREPYRVKYWSIGNEIWGGHMLDAHCDAHVYAKHVAEFAPAMRAVDPTIHLTAVGLPMPVWDGIVAAEAGQYFDALSAHDYSKPEGHDAASYKRLADMGSIVVRGKLEQCRKVLDEKGPAGKSIGIAFDEWNIWHNWFAAPFENEWHVGPVDGAFVAAVLNMLCRESGPLNIPIAALFQPINEGAIAVGPFSAQLTPAGQAHKLFKSHHGQRLVKSVSSNEGDVCASLSADGKRLCVTIVSHDCGTDDRTRLNIPASAKATKATLHLLSAHDTIPDKPMAERTEDLKIAGSAVEFVLPRFAIACITFSLQ